jgi:hypothetical protein
MCLRIVSSLDKRYDVDRGLDAWIVHKTKNNIHSFNSSIIYLVKLSLLLRALPEAYDV